MYYRDFHTAFISRFKAITFVNLVNPEIYAFFYLRKHIVLSVLFANETITIESNKSPSKSHKFLYVPMFNLLQKMHIISSFTRKTNYGDTEIPK